MLDDVLDESLKNNHEATSIAKASVDQAAKSNADSISLAKTALDDARKERERAIRPFLSISQCCNPTAIERTPNWSTGQPFLRIPFSEEKQHFPDGFNVGFVARLTNLGPGAARDVQAVWHPTKIVETSGRSYAPDPEPPAGNKYQRVFSWPKEVTSGGQAEIHHLPSCVYDDSEQRITYVEGFIELTCVDIAGDPQRFTYNFTLETSYNFTNYGANRVSCVYVHIDKDLELDGPYPHVVAHPVVPDLSDPEKRSIDPPKDKVVSPGFYFPSM